MLPVKILNLPDDTVQDTVQFSTTGTHVAYEPGADNRVHILRVMALADAAVKVRLFCDTGDIVKELKLGGMSVEGLPMGNRRFMPVASLPVGEALKVALDDDVTVTLVLWVYEGP